MSFEVKDDRYLISVKSAESNRVARAGSRSWRRCRVLMVQMYGICGAGAEKGREPVPRNWLPCATVAQVPTPKSYLRQ